MVLTIEFLKNNLIFSCRNQASKITQIIGDEKLKNTAQALKKLPTLSYLKYFGQRATVL